MEELDTSPSREGASHRGSRCLRPRRTVGVSRHSLKFLLYPTTWLCAYSRTIPNTKLSGGPRPPSETRSRCINSSNGSIAGMGGCLARMTTEVLCDPTASSSSQLSPEPLRTSLQPSQRLLLGRSELQGPEQTISVGNQLHDTRVHRPCSQQR